MLLQNNIVGIFLILIPYGQEGKELLGFFGDCATVFL